MTARIIITALVLALMSPLFVHATDSGQMTPGEVRRVNMDAKKITLRHGPIPNLDMPSMTMVFQVKEPAMLDQVKIGDKVKFTAEYIGGALTITHIEGAK
jgi:Cu/Ag efflux protein CusF